MLSFCADDDPKISEKVAVLHVDDCGDVVEKVSEVTPSHVKLSEPIFSPRAALMKAGFPVKMKCKTLIYYKPNTPFLKLHVYLIPKDPALQQVSEYLTVTNALHNKIQNGTKQWSVRDSFDRERKSLTVKIMS